MNTEAAFDASCVALREAEAAFKRSRTIANLNTLRAAQDTHEAAAAACRAEQDAAEVAFLRAERLAAVAPRRALRARQATMAF